MMKTSFLLLVFFLFYVRCFKMKGNFPKSIRLFNSNKEEDILGVVIVDHGSRRTEANEMLRNLVARFKMKSVHKIVEPAHMELAEPSIKTAFEKCIQQGATKIVCHPYFLSLGRHVQEDIPSLVNEASNSCGGIEFVITEPIGLQEELLDLIEISINKKLDI